MARKPASELDVRREVQRFALLFIYRYARGFSTHGSEMYLGPCTGSRGNRSKLTQNEATAERDRGQVDPAIGGLFAHKDELFQQDPAAARILLPALAGGFKGCLDILLGPHFRDSHVRNVRPLFGVLKFFGIELSMQIAHAMSRAVDADKDRGRYRKKGSHGTKRDLEGMLFPADAFQNLEGRVFRAA